MIILLLPHAIGLYGRYNSTVLTEYDYMADVIILLHWSSSSHIVSLV